MSDPANPVPLVGVEAIGMPRDYMASDQSFAARRPDVRVYRSPVLAEDVTVRGPIGVDLHVSTTGTDSDFVVKVLDEATEGGQAGKQILVRGEPFRGKYRKSFEKPVPFTPGEPDEIRFELADVAHTFRKGHRIVVHVQSSWLPLDRSQSADVHRHSEREALRLRQGDAARLPAGRQGEPHHLAGQQVASDSRISNPSPPRVLRARWRVKF